MTPEVLEFDVLIVGAGPSGLSAAWRLSQLADASGTPLRVAVLEKGKALGAHVLSGAVLDPRALRALVPDCDARGAPLRTPVREDGVYVLTERRAVRLPVTPPLLRNTGSYVVSLSELVEWLGALVEGAGVDIFTGFAGQEVLIEGERVVGVRTGDSGRSKTGAPKASFEPGVEVRAKVTILCDGVRGNLTRTVTAHFGLDERCQPQQFALGLKELWEVPEDRWPPGRVGHTIGFPLRGEEFGGGFIYGLAPGRVALGLVVGLDYRDPRFDPHVAFNRFKQHPFVTAIVRDGRLARYGAKAIPEGGWNAIPRLAVNGALLAGDAAGLVNAVRLKGIHLAMESGALAAEAAFRAITAGDVSTATLSAYDEALRRAVEPELYPVRHVRQAFEGGLVRGLAYAGVAALTNGRGLPARSGRAGHTRMQRVSNATATAAQRKPLTPDRVVTFDKLTGVHHSGTAHQEDRPSHLQVDTSVCTTVCGPAFGHPCVAFCPASVYEITRDPEGRPRLQVNASNCLHCKTCDIMDPYQAIRWVPPEGGGGPLFKGM